MDNYEIFKTEFLTELKTKLPELKIEDLETILHNLDAIAQKYDIEKKELELIILQEGYPQILKLFIASKAIEEKSPGTLALYKLILSNFLAAVGKPFTQITTNDIRIYLYNYKQSHGVKNVTLDTMRRIINSFYEWCVSENLITKNPTKNIKPIKSDATTREPLSPLELEYMRQACRNAREKAIIDFLYSTGCRVSEMCNAKLINIDWKKKSVFIEHGKGGYSRFVYLNAEAEVSLRAYLVSRTYQSEYIFAPARKAKLTQTTPRAIQKLVKNIVKRANIDPSHKITPHVLRHTTATQALHNGMPIEQVQKLLGHKQINTTLIYTKLDDAEIQAAHSKYIQ